MAQNANDGEVGRLINLMPVGLKEAAIDSPTARATVSYYGEQIELLERWLEDYLRATNRLIAESTTLDNVINNFISHATLPTAISETMLDHDYSVLAIKKYSESAKDFWMSMVSVVKRLNATVCEHIRHFQTAEIKPFKEARRLVEQTQKHYDSLHGKFAALTKSKEPSSIREDAFQLHEARKQYLQASMNFFQIAPHFRFALDKLIVRIFCDQYKEMRSARELPSTTFQRNSHEMERVQGWVREMEDSERIFKKELSTAKKQLEEAAEGAVRPSRELDDYSVTTVSYLGHSHTTSGAILSKSLDNYVPTAEKQGWLYLKTYTGKPTRTVWIRRWAFVRSGVFGWLVQGNRAGGVEESERIGVLLCSVRPAPGEERRFCFELKTNKNTIILQADNQAELLSWMKEIEAAKAKAVDNPASSDAVTPGPTQADPAFAITAPPVPEFGTYVLKSTEPGSVDDAPIRSDTLPPSMSDAGSQIDIHRRATAFDEAPRDQASRIMSKLDLHKRTPTGPQVSSPTTPSAGGGIASLIAASHGSMPVGPSLPMVQNHVVDPVMRKPTFALALRDMPSSTLAPPTLANVPAPTSLSKSAVVISGERGIRGTAMTKDGIPNSILANTWGSTNGSYLNRFDRSEAKTGLEGRAQPSPRLRSAEPVPEASGSATMMTMDLALPPSATKRTRTPSPPKGRRQTIGSAQDIDIVRSGIKLPEFPSIYPIQLKTQDAQFRLLFPNVKRDERLVLVFRATWNPNDQQEFPGRVYVTMNEMYFYSNHFGMVLTAVVALASVEEVTAAPGKDCDFLFMHLKEEAAGGIARRITIKIFLEPLRLLQRRLNFLAQNSVDQEPLRLEDMIKRLLRMENEVVRRTPSLESWEDISPDTPVDGIGARSRSNTLDVRAPVRVDRSLFASLTDREAAASKFKLPAQPVKYTPVGYTNLAIEREYDLSPKALFHVMFGDKSLLWQLLQHERKATDLKQGPWTTIGEGRLYRDFEFSVPSVDFFGQPKTSMVRDYQFVDVNNDHLCYVVTDKRTAWHLPNQHMYRLVSKIVITHVAKSKCKLAIYTKVEWQQDPWYLKNILDRQAMYDLNLDAQDITDLVSDQVRRLGPHSRTKKAIQIFGAVGQSSDVTQLQVEKSAIDIELRRIPTSRTITSLLVQDFSSKAQTVVDTVLDGITKSANWLSKTISANTVILVLLAASAIYNSWFVLRDGRSWYQERNTAKFLQRVGVGPNHVMSKAVYLNDIHEVMTGAGVLPQPQSSLCYQVFYDEHYLKDLNAPIIDKDRDDVSIESAKRIQSARQQMGGYRHDLLVAMRVVNSIEKEMVRSEWEGWLTDEHRKCRAIEPMIHKAANGTRKDAESSKEVRKWYDNYCTSCNDEYGRVRTM